MELKRRPGLQSRRRQEGVKPIVHWCAPSNSRERWLRAACGAVNPGSYDINIERVTCKKCKLVGSHGQEERLSVSKEPKGE